MVLDMMKELCSALAEAKDVILMFRGLRFDKLEEAELERLKPIIVDFFNRFARMRSIGFTGASKLLHLLAPKFFVMWDAEIRKYYGLGQDAGSYFEFLRRMRREIREAVKGYAKDRE